uniref:DUF4760 domain-containing protein n=1 Tax=Candidatus Methanogaster sp. ANME-2c ERB4 TaxID=2759911 RepID=A0A7G9YIP7_9EURY|nr:hypothetical protein LLFONJKP_00002 [Methanosarcinales archaeon ANME-2c ERB4]
MDWNTTEFAVTSGESINWLSTVIGIVGSILAIVSAYFLLCDRKNMRKATLYFPLFLACRGIVEIVKDHATMGEDRSRDLFVSCAMTLDKIVYTHGSIIHLKRADNLDTFLSLKDAIDENLGFVENESWADLKEKFKSDEFTKVESYANTLLSRCKEEVRSIRELP